jgi:taurine dioxygenase
MRLQPLTVGVDVLDVDLAAGIDRTGEALSIDELRAAFDDQSLLRFAGQKLSGEQQVAFVARFGPLLAERRLWGYVSNVRDDGIVREGALLFHSDFAFTRMPVQAISLHALEIPSSGAPTLFADARRAAALLPADLRSRLEGRRVFNLYDFSAPGDRTMRRDSVRPGSPGYEHPLLAPHPSTGAEVVMANEMHSDSIVGLPPAESDALLRDLFAVLYDDSNVLRYDWSVGDLVLWDNIAVHHARPDFPEDEPRTLQRVVLGDYTPGELVPNLEQLLAHRPGGPASAQRPGSPS